MKKTILILILVVYIASIAVVNFFGLTYTAKACANAAGHTFF